MNASLVTFLKEARVHNGLKQQEVGEILGCKANTISNWESGRTEPDIDTLMQLCQIYKVDFAGMLNDLYNFGGSRESLILNSKEQEHIKKYRKLDLRGQRSVDETLQREYDFSQNTKRRL